MNFSPNGFIHKYTFRICIYNETWGLGVEGDKQIVQIELNIKARADDEQHLYDTKSHAATWLW